MPLFETRATQRRVVSKVDEKFRTLYTIRHGNAANFLWSGEKYYVYFEDNSFLFSTLKNSKSANDRWSYCKSSAPRFLKHRVIHQSPANGHASQTPSFAVHTARRSGQSWSGQVKCHPLSAGRRHDEHSAFMRYYLVPTVLIRHNKTLIAKTSELNERDFIFLQIFTRTYTDIYKYWNYLLMFSFIVTSVFCIVMGCACQLVIKENDDDDDYATFRSIHNVLYHSYYYWSSSWAVSWYRTYRVFKQHWPWCPIS